MLPVYGSFVYQLTAVGRRLGVDEGGEEGVNLFMNYESYWVYCTPQNTYIYLKYHSVCPFVRIGTNTPQPKGGDTLAWGRSQFGRLEKKPSTLSTLWCTLY